MPKPPPLALCLALALAAPCLADGPKGEVTEHALSGSKVFPGTERKFWVYVPRQYDGKTPACVYVNQDRVQFDAPAAFDALIAEGAMPVTVGVFVQPGVVPPARGGALPRFNRSLEYDGLGPNYATFVLDELLPAVEKLKTSDGRPIVLSKSGNDRAIGGSSSGAVCAFTAAWERPDAFSRVFSSIGTYVGLRGANDYPTLIRKYEPKPLRVFLEDGTNDLNIYAGDWWMVNQEMQRALTFAGYEVAHRWGDGGHDDKLARKVFPEAMRFLWKDWPAPVKAGQGSAQMKEVLLPGEGWKLVSEGHRFTEGPVATASGEVLFNDGPNNVTHRLGLDGKRSEFANQTRGGNGAALRADGAFVTAASGAKEIRAYKPDGTYQVIASNVAGNDLTVRKDGTIYLTEPAPSGPGKVRKISPDGKITDVDTGLLYPNGITLSPDQTLLYVADYRSHWVYSLQIAPDGSLSHKQRYYHLHAPDTADDAGADGMRTDTDGRLYVATRLGIQFCDQAGRVNGIIPTPNGRVSNLTFGGKDFDTIFATCGDKVYSRKVRVRGANHWADPVTPKAPRL